MEQIKAPTPRQLRSAGGSVERYYKMERARLSSTTPAFFHQNVAPKAKPAEIRKTETGFAIKFPFAMKDAFRTAFPSAKWNPEAREWNVGPRSGKRLEAWAAECTQTADDIIARKEAETEAARIHAEAEDARKQAAAAAQCRAELEAARGALEAAQQELEKAKEEAKAAKLEAQSEHRKTVSLLAQYVNLDAISEAKNTMERNMNPADRVMKARFEDARQIVKSERDKLAVAGLVCQGISELARANVNRPDRDHPRNIPALAWFSVRKIQLGE